VTALQTAVPADRKAVQAQVDYLNKLYVQEREIGEQVTGVQTPELPGAGRAARPSAVGP
jgi:hypothetical protein